MGRAISSFLAAVPHYLGGVGFFIILDGVFCMSSFFLRVVFFSRNIEPIGTRLRLGIDCL